MTVEIVLATYNGEKYLAAQINSIIAQDFKDWKLILRDDGSSDGTPGIIALYEQKYPEQISALHTAPGDKKRLGIMANFSALLSATTAPYVMCCDQDDVWLPNKISLTLAGMRELEKMHGSDKPLLVHTDSIITNEGLETVAASFGAHHKLNPKKSPFARLLVQNTVQGCTAMVNRALLELALPLPPAVRMHDMWMALVAAGMGQIGYIAQGTVQYRQHSSNAVGARKKTLRERAGLIQTMMEANVTQALLYHDRFKERLSDRNRELARALSTLPDKGFFGRRSLLITHSMMREPSWQNLPIMIFI